MPTTAISIAFLRRIYAVGTLTLTEAREVLIARWPSSPDDILDYHLEFALAHFTGVLPSFSDPHGATLVADPQTPEQREALAALERHDLYGYWTLSLDEWRKATWMVPYRFAPGMRRRYQYHGFGFGPEQIPPCPSC